MSDDAIRQLLWNGIAYAAVATTALLTVLGLYLFVPQLRKRWFPLPRLRPVTWTGHEVFLAFCLVFGSQSIIIVTLIQLGFFTSLIGLEPPDSAAFKEYFVRCGIISSPLILTVTLGILFAVMYLGKGCRPHRYGLSWGRWPANLALGLRAFIVATPIVLGLFVLVSLVSATRTHQLTLVGKNRPAEWVWVLMGFQTTVASPLLEEILMRGILQGWLRRASLTGHLVVITLTIFLPAYDVVRYDSATETFSYNFPPAVFAGVLTAGYGYSLYRLARRFGLKEEEIQQWQPAPGAPPLHGASSESDEEASERRQRAREVGEQRSREWEQANAWLAIYGSSMVFASIHSAWPAPVPLFPLGLVLAWLHYRTQSLIGPITLHAAFNLVGFIALYGSVLTAPEPNGNAPEKKGNAETTAVRPSLVGSMPSSVPTSQFPLRK